MVPAEVWSLSELIDRLPVDVIRSKCLRHLPDHRFTFALFFIFVVILETFVRFVIGSDSLHGVLLLEVLLHVGPRERSKTSLLHSDIIDAVLLHNVGEQVFVALVRLLVLVNAFLCIQKE